MFFAVVMFSFVIRECKKFVIPAKAGIHFFQKMDTCLRRYDKFQYKPSPELVEGRGGYYRYDFDKLSLRLLVIC